MGAWERGGLGAPDGASDTCPPTRCTTLQRPASTNLPLPPLAQVQVVRRPNREGFKAGALVAGLEQVCLCVVWGWGAGLEQVIVWMDGELQKTQMCVHACVPLYLTVHRTVSSCYTVSTQSTLRHTHISSLLLPLGRPRWASSTARSSMQVRGKAVNRPLSVKCESLTECAASRSGAC